MAEALTMGTEGISRVDEGIQVGFPSNIVGNRIDTALVTLDTKLLRQLCDEADENGVPLFFVGSVLARPLPH